MEDSTGFDKFHIYWHMSEIYRTAKDPEEELQNDKAVDALEQSLQSLNEEELAKQLKEMKDERMWVLTQKAQALKDLKKVDESLAVFTEARSVCNDNTLPGWTVDQMFLLFNKENDPTCSRSLELMQSWSEKERNGW